MEQRHDIVHLRGQCESLLPQIFLCEKTIREFRAWERGSQDDICAYMPPPRDAGRVRIGDHWESVEGYLYLYAQVDLPQSKAGQKVFGRFDFSSIHEGYGHGFEAMLYVEGEPWHGVDDNHMLVTLEKWAGRTVALEFVLWVGITGKSPAQKTHIIRAAEVGWLDDDLENAATLLDMAISVSDTLPNADQTRLALLTFAQEMASHIRWNEGRETLRRTAIEGSERLKTKLSMLPKPSVDCILHCVGHTHIDYAWLWRVKHTREKIARSFSTVLRLMEEFPEYRFFQSSPEYYHLLEQDYPALFEQARRAIREKRWEAGGGMWVEADCNLISGESMIRQILTAKRFFQTEFGVSDQVVWLPDTFGFTWTMPQILKKSGIVAFFTSKLSWNQASRFPQDTFWWQGLDGSRVLASFLTVPAEGFPPQPWATTYNGEISPQALKQTWELYQNKDISKDLLYLYGYGDGGGGSTRTMIKRLRALKELPFPVEILFGTANGFFSALERQAKDHDTPVWADELYLECHRGTYTSQAFAKRENRRLEQRLRNSEFFQAVRTLWKNDHEETRSLQPQWRMLLRNQFHDILPGSSVRAVYDDLKREYATLHEMLDNIDRDCFASSEQAEGYMVWNTGGWERDALIELPASEREGWMDGAGQALESVYLGENSHLVALRSIPPFSATHIIPSKQDRTPGECAPLARIDLCKRTLETPRYFVQWAQNGQLTHVISKNEGFEVFADGESGNQLIAYEDRPALFDAWDIDADYVDNFELIENLVQASVLENNMLRTVLQFQFLYRSSTLTQNMIFSRDDAAILFEHHVNWHEHQRLLRVEFPLNVVANFATFDIPFGQMVRPTTQTTAHDQARFEVPAHRWADMSQRNRGVSLLNDCKYGHSAKGNRLGLSLIKSAIDPDEEADQGTHVYIYALYPHGGNWRAAGTQQRAAALCNPPVIMQGARKAKFPPLFQVSGEMIEVDAVKCAENGDSVLLRLHEYGGKRSEVKVESVLRFSSFCECDLMEQPLCEWVMVDEIRFTIAPYEIKSFLIRMH